MAACYRIGMGEQLAELRAAEMWEPLPVAMLAEAVAVLALEVKPTTTRRGKPVLAR